LASRGLEPDGMHQPAQAGFASCSRGVHPDGKRRISDLFLNLHQPAVSACGRGRPRSQDARGSIVLPIALSGENARAPQGLPRAQGGLQPARATSRPRRRASPRVAEGFTPTARGAYRIYFSISISPQSPHAGGDAAHVELSQDHERAVSACGRGRPRTQDARGSISPFSPCGRRGQGG
jgi:hypothetical protein